MQGRIDSGPKSALRVLLEEFDGIAHGQNGLRGVVGNFAIEFFFERHDELDGVETVGAEIVDEAGVLRNLVGIDAEILDDDLFHPLGNITHRSNLMFQRDPLGLGLVSSSVTAAGRHRSEADRCCPALRLPGSPSPMSVRYHTSPGLASAAARFGVRSPALHSIAMPPLTCSVCPVTYAPSLEARNNTAAATSSVVPARPAGIFAKIVSRCLSLSLSVIGVTMNPGATQLAVTPRLAYSCA